MRNLSTVHLESFWASAGRGARGGLVLVLLVLSGQAVAADAYLDALEMEVLEVDRAAEAVEATPTPAPDTARAGEGFSSFLTHTQFAREMEKRHPAGSALFLLLSKAEQNKIYHDYYRKGASYKAVVEVMHKWLEARQ